MIFVIVTQKRGDRAIMSFKQLVLAVFVTNFLVVEADSDENYLDSAASWDISEDSVSEFIKVTRLNGNSSGVNAHAKRLKELEKIVTQIIANKINAQPKQIYFTSSATLSNNIAILGVAYKHPKCHLITSKIEHKSVLNVFKHLEQLGWRVTYLNVNQFGKVDLKQLNSCLQPDTKLISIQMFNSEIGTLQNLFEIGQIAHEKGILFHSDASQSFCKYDIDVEKMHIDLITVSGYKIGSPKGIGVLYVRDSSQLQPIIFGSGDKLFPGTKPTALICAFAKAVDTFKIDKNAIARNFQVLVHELKKIPDIFVNSQTPSHVISVSIDKISLSDILERMNNYSFSAGCSCSGGEHSNVLEAIDPNHTLPNCTLRISFTDRTTEKTLIDFSQKLGKVVETLRKEKVVGKGCTTSHNNKPKGFNNNLEKIQELMKMENIRRVIQ